MIGQSRSHGAHRDGLFQPGVSNGARPSKTGAQLAKSFQTRAILEVMKAKTATSATLIGILLLLGVMLPMVASAQRLESSVSVNLQKLPQENQNKLRGLDRTISAYINDQDWAPNDYDYTFKLAIEIYFESVAAISFEDRYEAQIIVSNQSNMQYSDKRWGFALDPGTRLAYSDQFESFRSMIDFMVYMALGYEFDKVKKFGGTPFFENARKICQQARFSSRYFTGWDRREEWVTEVLSEKNEPQRYLNFLYFTGEWLYYTERDRVTAKQYLIYAARLFDRLEEAELKRFFDLNYYNYASALAEYKEFTTLAKIAATDPNPEHSSFYKKLLEKR